MRAVLFVVLLVAAPFAGGCKKESCEKLLQIACERVSKAEDGDEQCAKLRQQAESVSDDDCQKTLRLLKETGKLQTTPR